MLTPRRGTWLGADFTVYDFYVWEQIFWYFVGKTSIPTYYFVPINLTTKVGIAPM